MSQEQPRRRQSDDLDPIRYGDLFDVHGDLASKPIAPRDASAMQAAENRVLGQTPRGGPAPAMHSAASFNLKEGLVRRDQASIGEEGMSVTEINAGGDRIVTERVAGQLVGQYIEPRVEMTSPGSALDRDAFTIAEALEATAISARDKPIDQSDAAAIQAAEVRATGISEVLPGGVGAEAQPAATLNPRVPRDEDKTTLGNVRGDATAKLPADKAATREDAERVIGAEVRNRPEGNVAPGGVAASLAAAAGLNQNKRQLMLKLNKE